MLRIRGFDADSEEDRVRIEQPLRMEGRRKAAPAGATARAER